jgi:hypothetical protein
MDLNHHLTQTLGLPPLIDWATRGLRDGPLLRGKWSPDLHVQRSVCAPALAHDPASGGNFVEGNRLPRTPRGIRTLDPPIKSRLL